MSYLYNKLKSPTRLYIKQCPHCGLKYFGKTTSKDIVKYRGSGVYWNNHLKKHKVTPKHLWNSDWYYDESIIKFALRFSKINKILENPNWANLKEENGIEGGWHYHKNSSKLKMSKNKKGRVWIKKEDQCKLIQPSELSDYISEGWIRGRVAMSEEQKIKISKSLVGKESKNKGKKYDPYGPTKKTYKTTGYSYSEYRRKRE